MAAPPPDGWVLYDDSCGVCRRWVPFWEKTLRRRGFAVAPLQAGWVADMLVLDGSALTDDVRLLLRDGSTIRGADVYRFAMKRIWWARPLYLLSVMPGLREVFDRAYAAFAKHRHAVSRFCGLPGGG